MKKLVFPGTFDPVTVGHVDVIKRAALMADEVIVALAETSGKQSKWTIEERLNFLKLAVDDLPNVQVLPFSGLLVEFLREHKVLTLVRGIRSVVDWSYEAEMAAVNAKLLPGLETVFLSAKEQISSTFVRQIYSLGGDITAFVPKKVFEAIKKTSS